MSEILVLPNLSYTSFEESFSEPPSLERHQCSWQSCSRPTEQCQETVLFYTHTCVYTPSSSLRLGRVLQHSTPSTEHQGSEIYEILGKCSEWRAGEMNKQLHKPCYFRCQI